MEIRLRFSVRDLLWFTLAVALTLWAIAEHGKADNERWQADRALQQLARVNLTLTQSQAKRRLLEDQLTITREQLQATTQQYQAIVEQQTRDSH